MCCGNKAECSLCLDHAQRARCFYVCFITVATVPSTVGVSLLPVRGTYVPALLTWPVSLLLPRQGYRPGGGLTASQGREQCFCIYGQGVFLFLGAGCLNVTPQELVSCSLGSHRSSFHHCNQELDTPGEGKANIICALTAGAAEKLISIDTATKIRPLQSLLFVEAIILHRRLNEYRTDYL